jgi:hypothetical protein
VFRSTVHQPPSRYYHNLGIGANSGKVWLWGCGTFTDGKLDGVIPALALGAAAAARLGDAADRGGPPTEAVGLEGERAIDVTGGAYHSVVLAQSGRVFTCGAAQLGQLGRRVGGCTDASGLPVDTAAREVEGLPPSATDAVRTIGAGFYVSASRRDRAPPVSHKVSH